MDSSGDRSLDPSNDLHVLLRRITHHILRSACLILPHDIRGIKLLLSLFPKHADDLHLPCFRSHLQRISGNNLSDLSIHKKMRSEQHIRLLRWRSLHLLHPIPQSHHKRPLVSHVPMIFLYSILNDLFSYGLLSVDGSTTNKVYQDIVSNFIE